MARRPEVSTMHLMELQSVYSLKPRFRASLRGVERAVIARGINADQVTAAGLACGVGAAMAILLSATSLRWLLCVPPLVLARLACNALDGMIAVDTNHARPIGQVANEFADRIADACILAMSMRAGSPLLGIVTLALVLLTSYLGTVAQAAGGTRQYIGVMGKADRMILLALAAPVAASGPAGVVLAAVLGVIAAGSAVTIAQRWSAIHRELTRSVS
jgi:CDP-diacylglycerol---glycerol-3-phosphate 3-phosphatidyltransferase